MTTMTDMTDDSLNTVTASATHKTRHQQLQQWLNQVFVGQDSTLHSLPGDASARQYHRLQLTGSQGAPARYIVMDSADEQEAMQQFINVAKLMAPAINVPELIAQDIRQGFLVLQDFGTTEFAHLLVDANTEQVNDYYQLAMQTLIALQKIPVETARIQHQLPDYDAHTLNREMDLFRDWFVPFIGANLDENIWSNLKSALITAILAQPAVIVHRDYHSRNLMQDQNDHSALGVIDFQDAVIGAYSYDLVSLIRDAYAEWPEAQVVQWMNDFWQMQQQAGLASADSIEQFIKDINIMGVQRHLKVLGIFIRLLQRDGKDRYLADIPKVMGDLILELDWLSEQSSAELKQAIQPFYNWLQTQAMAGYKSKFL